MKSAYSRWLSFVSAANNEKLIQDRMLWRLHATANVDKDLQAWYHTLFYREIYRLPGPFWYKDAPLTTYKKAIESVVDSTLTPLEEAALAHVLCSPDTTYGDVAGQMFIVQAITTPEQYAWFQHICADGMDVVKYPRSGKAAEKLFRFSFVEGNIFLTWKGKYGNQGVDMNEISDIVPGIQTEILLKRANTQTPDLYLSIICADRSIDLRFTTEIERNDWKVVLGKLLQKELGVLDGIKTIRPRIQHDAVIPEEDIFEWLVLFHTIGRYCLPDEIFDCLTKTQ